MDRTGGAQGQVPFWGGPSWAPWHGLREPSPTTTPCHQHLTEMSIVLQPEACVLGGKIIPAWWTREVPINIWLKQEARRQGADSGSWARWAGFGQSGWQQPPLAEEEQLGFCCLGRGHLTAQR